ncbi:MAG: FG-GAP repeat protein [Planctomycetota bacterium]
MQTFHFASFAVCLSLLAAPSGAQCELDQFAAGDPFDDSRFGSALDVSGAIAVVGAPSSFVPSDPGAAYVFERDGLLWVEVAKLTPPDGASADRFGTSVAVHGSTVVVGAPLDDDGGMSSGSAYVFTATGGAWSFARKLTAPDAAAGAVFGTAVAIQSDTIIVGAPRAPLNPGHGAAYVFVGSGANWSLQAQLAASDTALTQREFAETLAFDGDRCVIGTQSDIAGGEGAAFVFERSGVAWSETAMLTATLPFPSPSVSDEFGSPVALDGDTIVVGAPGYDGGGSYDEGAAFVFVKNGAAWSQETMLVATGGATVTNVGRSLALAGDDVLLGSRVAVSGSVHHFRRRGTNWNELGSLLPAGASDFDDVGAALAVDGDTLLIASSRAHTGSVTAGAVSAWSLAGLGCPSLLGAPAAVSVGTGGTHRLRLDAGAAHAGELYLVLGSLRGSSPGFYFGGFVIPLTLPSPYFNLTLTNPNSAVLVNTFSALDAAGRSTAAFVLPPGSNPSLVGRTAHHAFVTLDFTSNPGALQISFAGNAADVQLVP